MENIINEIVDADKKARMRVEQKKQERQNIQNLMQMKKEEIVKKYQEETRKHVEEKKKAMKEELEKVLTEEEIAYNEALIAMQKRFDDHQSEWIEELYQHCLGS